MLPVTEPMMLRTRCTATITIVMISSGPTFFQ